MEAEFAHGVLLAGGYHIVLGLRLLQDEPHALHIVLGVSPVTQRREIAEVQLLLLALGDAGCGEGDFACHECLASAFRLVVEQYARAAVHSVSLAILLHDPEAVELGDSVGRIGVKRGVLILWHLLHLSIQLGGGCLIDAASVFQSAQPDCLKDAQHTCGVDIGSELGRVKRYLHVALRGEVVDFIRADFAHHLQYRHRVAEVGIVQVEIRLTLKMSYAFTEVHRRAAYRAVHVISFFQ